MKQAFMRGLLAVLLVGSVLLIGCFDYSEVEQVTTQENVEAQTEAAENDADDDSLAENVEIEDIAAPEDDSSDEEDPASQGEENGNSRTNPAGLNEAFTVYKDDWINEGDNAVVAVDRRTNAEIWFDLRAGA